MPAINTTTKLKHKRNKNNNIFSHSQSYNTAKKKNRPKLKHNMKEHKIKYNIKLMYEVRLIREEIEGQNRQNRNKINTDT